jgi:hypothetical protein
MGSVLYKTTEKEDPQMKKILVVLGILVLVPCLALAQGSYYVDYYSNNVDHGFDQLIRIINVGTLGTPLTSPVGDICANVYVFDANQEMLACCAKRITPNGLASAAVHRQLTNNTVTTVVPPTGVVKIVLAQPPGATCTPTTIGATPDAGLGVVFGTHLQKEGSGGGNNNPYLFVTETQKAPSTLSSQEQGFLQQACSFALYIGSGQGTCTISADGNVE